jgi:alanine dehydrogenase
MPGAYPRASTIALTTVTLKYIQEIATHSLHSFLADKGKMKAINVYQGKICSEQIAMDLNLTEYFESVDERVRHSSA